MRLAIGIAGLLLVIADPAITQEATTTVPTTTLDCTLAPGTTITALAASGSPGRSIKWTIPPKSHDLAISGSTLVVAPGGITPADCGKTSTITVSGTFMYVVKAPPIPNLVADDSATALQADDSTNELMGQ